jgi:hypothetical protein
MRLRKLVPELECYGVDHRPRWLRNPTRASSCLSGSPTRRTIM